MKILTICSAGTVRSVGMAFVLKHYGHDALALSHSWNSKETAQILCAWADKIIPMTPEFHKNVPPEFQHKILNVNIGMDVWKNPLHPELLDKCKDFAKQHGLSADVWLHSKDQICL